MSKYQALKEAPSLHDQIMNIEAKPAKVNGINYILPYKVGHRDARHAAAELAQAQDATISAILADLEAAKAAPKRLIEAAATLKDVCNRPSAARTRAEAWRELDAALAQMAKGE